MSPPKLDVPGPVPREALAYFDAKELRPGFDHRDVWKDEHNVAFTVAKAMETDVLETIRGEVQRALREGTTLEDFQKRLQPMLEKLGWWGRQERTDPVTGETRTVQLGSPRRLEVIYRTNLRTARAAGQWERIQRTKEDQPFLQYRLGPSERHRPEHASWSGTILPVDDPFWETHMPPNGWGCKCYVIQLSETQAERAGGQTPRPDTTPVAWYNSRTGQTEFVPVGIDPGWNYNPGITRLPPSVRGPSSPPVTPAREQLVSVPQRSITAEPGVLERAAKLLGKKVDEKHLAALSGLQQADVDITHGAKGSIRIVADADIPTGGWVSAVRAVRVGDDGRPYLENALIKISDDAQGKGLGTGFFAQQVEAARALGLPAIKAYAARGDGYNGYYTWPRMGYDGDLPEHLQALTGFKRISELMQTPELVDLWREKGEGFAATFDLTPGSRSLQQLEAYVREKKGAK